MTSQINLIRKYNVPGPRYTGYPTLAFWDPEKFDIAAWTSLLRDAFNESKGSGISLYIHLPFCENLCTFCACPKHVTRDHQVERTYIRALLAEWKMYCRLFEIKPRIKSIHFGGGTPTFFSAKHLEDLVNGILCLADCDPDPDFSFDGHPNNTTREHLQTLRALGFRRVSFGVQDYSAKVQKAINRIQPLCNVARVTLWARELGYTSVSHDVLFGLPFQTTSDMIDTIEKTLSMQPDRIAFHSYAHLPWPRLNGRRGYGDCDVPEEPMKRALYETGREILLKNGYFEVGMDHFALPTDSLYRDFEMNAMSRNITGYGPRTQLTVGLGASAIGDSWHAFSQNAATLEDYHQLVEWGQFPITRGHLHTPEDLAVRRHMLELACNFETQLESSEVLPIEEILQNLAPLTRDGLVKIEGTRITVTAEGKPFVLNICKAFDLRSGRTLPREALFSNTL